MMGGQLATGELASPLHAFLQSNEFFGTSKERAFHFIGYLYYCTKNQKKMNC